MREWRAELRARLAPLGINPTTEMDIVDEIAQHLEDRCAELGAAGLSEAEAADRVAAELDAPEFAADLADALRRQ